MVLPVFLLTARGAAPEVSHHPRYLHAIATATTLATSETSETLKVKSRQPP